MRKHRQKTSAKRSQCYTRNTVFLLHVYIHDNCTFFWVIGSSCYDSHHRVCKDLELDIFNQLGDTNYIHRAYRMDKQTFYKLHKILWPWLENHFFPKEGENQDIYLNPYLIKTEVRLSITLHYFTRASPYDVVITQGVSMTPVFSIWSVVDCVNKCSHFGIVFPDYKGQMDIPLQEDNTVDHLMDQMLCLVEEKELTRPTVSQI